MVVLITRLDMRIFLHKTNKRLICYDCYAIQTYQIRVKYTFLPKRRGKGGGDKKMQNRFKNLCNREKCLKFIILKQNGSKIMHKSCKIVKHIALKLLLKKINIAV